MAVTKVLDRISERSGQVFAWLVIPLMGALVYEVVARYVFGRPTQWAFDISYMLYGSHFMLVAAYALYRGKHIRTDFFYRLLSPRWQGVLDAALYLLFFFPGMGLFLWTTWEFASRSWLLGERYSLTPWMPPIYPLKTVLPVAAALLLLQGVSEFLKSLHAAVHGEWP
jgi:TRAP-type mannitol/chloroaromatic compound transport system permease small subunit